MDSRVRRLARNDAADTVCLTVIACGDAPVPLSSGYQSLRHCETQSVEAIHAFLEWIATLAGSLAMTQPIRVRGSFSFKPFFTLY
jgi:hypothetical protein